MNHEEQRGEDQVSELELLNSMTPDDVVFVLTYADDALFNEKYHPALSEDDIVAIKTRAAILMKADPELAGGTAVCRAAKGRLEIRSSLSGGVHVAVDQSSGLVHSVNGNKRIAIADAKHEMGRGT